MNTAASVLLVGNASPLDGALLLEWRVRRDELLALDGEPAQHVGRGLCVLGDGVGNGVFYSKRHVNRVFLFKTLEGRFATYHRYRTPGGSTGPAQLRYR